MRVLFMKFVVLSLLSAKVIAQDNVVLEGRIADSSVVEVTFLTRNNALENRPVVLAKTKVDPHGYFKVAFSINEAHAVKMYIGTVLPMQIWMSPNDSMYLEINEPWSYTGRMSVFKPGKVVFSGSGSMFNNYLFASHLSIVNPEIQLLATQTSPSRFDHLLDSIAQSERSQRNAVNAQLSGLQREFLEGQTSYLFRYYKSMYNAVRESNGVKEQTSFDLPIWDQWRFLSDSAIVSDGYISAVINYFNYKGSLQTKFPTNDLERQDFFSAAFRSCERELRQRPQSRELFMAIFLYNMVRFVHASDSARELAKVYDLNFPQSRFNSIIKLRMGGQSSGKKAPSLVASDLQNTPFDLKTITAKIVYIDVWASWCAPCIAQFENLAKLAKMYNPDELQIIGLNIDDSDVAWRRIIRERKPVGLQIRANQADSKAFKDAYGINNIPRYILIDQNWNLIAPSAKGPSEIGSELSALIKHKQD
ncbi:TlpA disulfide reductase family protein [Chryseolinea sp. T2]|uniref:TlpA family protein disulfide reductase n=1 Tax=Chryseolinea sp. T2 TaxID=3129255 RepID=UPI003077083F